MPAGVAAGAGITPARVAAAAHRAQDGGDRAGLAFRNHACSDTLRTNGAVNLNLYHIAYSAIGLLPDGDGPMYHALVDLRFDDPELERLYTDARYLGRRSPNLVKSFRRLVFSILAAPDERTFYENKGLHYERVKQRAGCHSMKLNDQYRLIVTYEGGEPKTIVILEISDHYQI